MFHTVGRDLGLLDGDDGDDDGDDDDDDDDDEEEEEEEEEEENMFVVSIGWMDHLTDTTRNSFSS